MTQYENFRELTDEQYPECTTEQKIGVYIQHRPATIVAFLLELILELHPEELKIELEVEDPNDNPERTD